MKKLNDFLATIDFRRILMWNLAALFALKLALPFGGIQLATVLENVTVFNSREIITETNRVRQANGLAPLTANPQLDAAAQEKLNDMIKNSYFAHTSPQGVSPWYWIQKNNYTYTTAGENLALGYFTASDTVTAWMNSPSHKANLLNSNFQEIGVATGKATIQGITGVLTVQEFGKPKATVAVTNPPKTPAPTPIATATPVPATPTPVVATPEVAGVQLTPTPKVIVSTPTPKSEPIALQYVAIEEETEISPVSAPTEIAIEDNNSSALAFLSKINGVYQGYLALALVLMVIAMTSASAPRKRLAGVAMAHAAFLLVSIAVPALEVFSKGLVF